MLSDFMKNKEDLGEKNIYFFNYLVSCCCNSIKNKRKIEQIAIKNVANIALTLCSSSAYSKKMQHWPTGSPAGHHLVALICDDAIFHVSRAGRAGGHTSAEALGPIRGELIDGQNPSEANEARTARLFIR